METKTPKTHVMEKAPAKWRLSKKRRFIDDDGKLIKQNNIGQRSMDDIKVQLKFEDSGQSDEDKHDITYQQTADATCKEDNDVDVHDKACQQSNHSRLPGKISGEQYCKIDIGRDCYMVAKEFDVQIKVHLRAYDKKADGSIYPTKSGIALDLEKLSKLQNWHIGNVDQAIREYKDGKEVNLRIHLGRNV